MYRFGEQLGHNKNLYWSAKCVGDSQRERKRNCQQSDIEVTSPFQSVALKFEFSRPHFGPHMSTTCQQNVSAIVNESFSATRGNVKSWTSKRHQSNITNRCPINVMNQTTCRQHVSTTCVNGTPRLAFQHVSKMCQQHVSTAVTFIGYLFVMLL